jgi:hypothetical protein
VALFDHILKGGNLVTGVVVGAGALIAWPVVSPILWPLAKAKGGLWGYREATRLYGSTARGFGDIVKEALDELADCREGNGRGSRRRSR